MIRWQDVFSKDGHPWRDACALSDPLAVRDLAALKRFLDAVHIRHCLVRPYQEVKGVRHHFDDREEVQNAFNEMK